MSLLICSGAWSFEVKLDIFEALTSLLYFLGLMLFAFRSFSVYVWLFVQTIFEFPE